MSSGDALRARPGRPSTRLLAAVCGYWSAADGSCGGTERVRPYVAGPRCRLHTPAALAGRPEPDELLRAAEAVPAVHRSDRNPSDLDL